MENLLIEHGIKTPKIDLNRETGELVFTGMSVPENAAALYENVHKWIAEYSKNPKLMTNLRLNLDFFNSSSSIWLAKIVKELCTVKKNGYTLLIHLYFDIEEFDNMAPDDLKDALSPIIDIIGTPSISIGIKIYGTDGRGEVLKESMVLL